MNKAYNENIETKPDLIAYSMVFAFTNSLSFLDIELFDGDRVI